MCLKLACLGRYAALAFEGRRFDAPFGFNMVTGSSLGNGNARRTQYEKHKKCAVIPVGRPNLGTSAVWQLFNHIAYESL